MRRAQGLRPRRGASFWCLLLVLAARASAPQKPPGEQIEVKEARPHDAIHGILQAFDRYPLVALGEYHRNQQEHDFLVSLLRNAGLPDKVNDIVVEFGAARYQDLIDRYVDGQRISPDQLCHVWRDTVNIMVWDAPVYQRFFETVRGVNQRLPRKKRLRVLAGDPPFDWNEVQTKEQWEQLVSQRDTHPARLIETAVLAKGRRALILYGMGHVERFKSKPGSPPNLTRLLEQQQPGAVFVIWPYTDGWGDASALDVRLRFWPSPSLTSLAGTWLGAVSEDLGEPTLAELADAFLYVGPVESQTQSEPPDEVYRDPDFLRELLRRDKIQGGFKSAELRRLSGKFPAK